MITIDIYYNQQGRIYKYASQGHADSVAEGFDSVCAMVSLTTQTPILGLERVLKREVITKINSDVGILEVELKNTPDEQTQLLLATMVEALQELEEVYGEYLHTVKHRR